MNRFTSAMTVAALLICGLVGCNQESTTAKKPDASIVTPADNKQAFITLAKHLTDHWTTDRNAPRRQMDPTQMLAEAQQLFLDFDAIKTDDPALVKIRDEGKSGIQQGTTALRTIDQLPRPPGAGDLFVASFLYGFVLRPDLAVELGDRAQNQANAIQAQIRQFLSGCQRAEAAKLLLRRAGEKYTGTKVLLPSLFSVQIDEALLGQEPDWIALTNNTGIDLHNALVSVTLYGKNGESKENIHFIPSWRVGETIHCRYETGMVLGDAVVGRQTVMLIQSAKISIAADEGRQENITYHYAGAEKDKTVQRFLDKVNMTGKYQPYSRGFFGTNRGVTVKISGQPVLPKGKLTVWFRNGNLNKATSTIFTQWRSGQERTIEFPDITWDPIEYGIRVELEGSKATRTCSTPHVPAIPAFPRSSMGFGPPAPQSFVIQEIRTR